MEKQSRTFEIVLVLVLIVIAAAFIAVFGFGAGQTMLIPASPSVTSTVESI